MAIEFSGMNRQSALIGAGAIGGTFFVGDAIVNHKHRSKVEEAAEGTVGLGLAGAAGWGAYKQHKAGQDEDSIGSHQRYGFMGPHK